MRDLGFKGFRVEEFKLWGFWSGVWRLFLASGK